MKYPNESAELVALLAEDQLEWKAYAKAEQVSKLPANELQGLKIELRKKVTVRGKRALQILNTIDSLPSLKNIGPEAAIALSVLSTHYSLLATKLVLAAFEECYRKSPANTQISSIPAMQDWVSLLEKRPQRFGTIWLLDSTGYPFLPTVEDFETINKRRAAYNIGPLRWPKSLAIPEDDQAWLKQPISTAVMRRPTEAELEGLYEYLA